MIYAIQAGDGGPVKFGVAENPAGRLRELQTGNPERLRLLTSAPVAGDKECLIHHHLRDERMAGEWFRPTTKAWNVVWALERQAFYTQDHELANHIYDAEPESMDWFAKRFDLR